MQIISYSLFLFLLIFCPLAFGTVESWTLTVMETCTALSFLFLGAFFFLHNKPALRIPGIVPLFLLLGYMLLQLVPLPIPLVKILSPATFELYRPLLDIDPALQFVPLSVNRKSTLLTLFISASYALVYLLTIYHCSRADRLKKTAAFIVCLGVLIAVEAIIQKLTSPEAIYWFRATPNSTPLGPWVYKNHFAGFMEMLFPITIALFLFYRPQVVYDKSIREKFISAMTMPGGNRYLLLGTGAILIAVSILLSVSRGGIITLSIAFLFFTLFSARTLTDYRTRWAVILTVLVVLMITWLGWQPIIDKFGNIWGEEGLNTSGRFPVLMDSIRIFQSFPLFGTGFGTFIDVYPAVRTVPGEAVFDHAHNDYIELLASGGLIGFLICAWFVIAVLHHAIRKLLHRKDRYAILLTSGALTGILALLFHCLVDFQIYNGANGLYFFFLCGLTVSAVNTRLHYRTHPSLLEQGGKISLLLPGIFALFLLICSPWYFLNIQKAEKRSAPVTSVFLNRHISTDRLEKMHSTLFDASRLDPFAAKYFYQLGHISSFLGKKAQAQHEYLQASLRQPANGSYLQQLGISLATNKVEQKKTLLSLGLLREPLVLDGYLIYCDWLLKNNFRQEAFVILNRAMYAISWSITDIVNFMLPYRFTLSEIEQMLPPLPAIWNEIGSRMERYRRQEDAELFYTMTLDFLDGNEVKPNYFSRLYNLYLRQKKEIKALEILRMGIGYLPDYAPFRVQLGDYYHRQGINYRAAQEYTQALRLDPDNRYVLRKLEQLDRD